MINKIRHPIQLTTSQFIYLFWTISIKEKIRIVEKFRMN